MGSEQLAKVDKNAWGINYHDKYLISKARKVGKIR